MRYGAEGVKEPGACERAKERNAHFCGRSRSSTSTSTGAERQCAASCHLTQDSRSPLLVADRQERKRESQNRRLTQRAGKCAAQKENRILHHAAMQCIPPC